MFVSGYLESLLAIIKAITWQDDPGRLVVGKGKLGQGNPGGMMARVQ
ncbi:hypothetical protein JKV85_000573 [Salmonella enterica subsp. enterica serovar Newport]|nr:hypothetical protein [Salmonella enterica subsp. enterica serovar Newport]